MNKLSKRLHQEGFTCYAPLYSGHGLPPEVFSKYTTQYWWEEVVNAYEVLEKKGYKTIFIIGISLGAIFALNLAMIKKATKLIIMSTPKSRTINDLENRFIQYAKNYNQLTGVQNSDNDSYKNLMPNQFYEDFTKLIDHTIAEVDKIKIPTFVLNGLKDDRLYVESASYIYTHLSSNRKQLKGYVNAGHLMTLSKDRHDIETDIITFINEN
ncbi:carboxylesterase [Geomicrobium sp. JCM 19055]|uniref:alpha/beta hydrolase n=1 Tax=Geomicrobium sp. JCM 19055 TaxID=1460649 RepID=UPI00045ECFC2|nr:prolyl oligopeptidase family serine peptidase [Geomicrobium sp. JCM 19055]GAK00675.1 carboxylesterase [Geomicrobium sp. JCM 19055]